MRPLLEDGGLLWSAHRGVGYERVVDPDVEPYWDHYQQLEFSGPITKELNKFRVEFVAKHTTGLLLDIGIGNGAFLRARNATGAPTRGFDVNSKACSYLKEIGAFTEIFSEPAVESATFWDSLEHIEDPSAILARVKCFAFVSLPIFYDLTGVLRSKHYKPKEHRWYFTKPGLIWYFETFGFRCIDISHKESDIGRQDVETFAFSR